MALPSGLKQFVRTWMLPIAMLGGIIFHNYMGLLSPLSPILIGIMLFITYCKLNRKELYITRLSFLLVAVQIIGSILIYLMLRGVDENIAQTAFICVFCPTATAAPVITGMLGGSITRVATTSLLSNICVAVLAPMLFTLIGAHGHSSTMSFLHVTGLISLKVVPLILGPLVLAMILEKLAPKFHETVSHHQDLSFYVWALSLFIVIGNTVSYVITHIKQNPDEISSMIIFSLISLVLCLIQFITGRIIGRKYGDKVAGTQALGQKNTVLAIWMALTFLNPLTSVGPAAYVAWQNTINSYQIWRKNRHHR